MSVWISGLQVAAIGMMVVFSGLVLLIGVISLIKAFSGREKAPKAAPAPAQVAAPAAAPVQAAPQVLAGEDPQVVAAITAALSVVLGQQQAAPAGGFIVRRIRRT